MVVPVADEIEDDNNNDDDSDDDGLDDYGSQS